MIGAEGYRRMVATIRLDLLGLLGKSYISDHIRKEIREHQEKQLFCDYVADAIGAFAGANTMYSDLSAYRFPLFIGQLETRTEEEITNDNAKALAELCGGGDTA